jgi:hypothetical protein
MFKENFFKAISLKTIASLVLVVSIIFACKKDANRTVDVNTPLTPAISTLKTWYQSQFPKKASINKSHTQNNDDVIDFSQIVEPNGTKPFPIIGMTMKSLKYLPILQSYNLA